MVSLLLKNLKFKVTTLSRESYSRQNISFVNLGERISIGRTVEEPKSGSMGISDMIFTKNDQSYCT